MMEYEVTCKGSGSDLVDITCHINIMICDQDKYFHVCDNIKAI